MTKREVSEIGFFWPTKFYTVAQRMVRVKFEENWFNFQLLGVLGTI